MLLALASACSLVNVPEEYISICPTFDGVFKFTYNNDGLARLDNAHRFLTSVWGIVRELDMTIEPQTNKAVPLVFNFKDDVKADRMFPTIETLRMRGYDFDAAYDRSAQSAPAGRTNIEGWLERMDWSKLHTLDIDHLAKLSIVHLVTTADLSSLRHLALGGKESKFSGRDLRLLLGGLENSLTSLRLTNIDFKSFEGLIDFIAKHHPNLTSFSLHQTGHYPVKYLQASQIRYLREKLPGLISLDIDLPHEIPWDRAERQPESFDNLTTKDDLHPVLDSIVGVLGTFINLQHLTLRFKSSHLPRNDWNADNFIKTTPLILERIDEGQRAERMSDDDVIQTLTIVIGELDEAGRTVRGRSERAEEVKCLFDGPEVVCSAESYSKISDCRQIFTSQSSRAKDDTLHSTYSQGQETDYETKTFEAAVNHRLSQTPLSDLLKEWQPRREKEAQQPTREGQLLKIWLRKAGLIPSERLPKPTSTPLVWTDSAQGRSIGYWPQEKVAAKAKAQGFKLYPDPAFMPWPSEDSIKNTADEASGVAAPRLSHPGCDCPYASGKWLEPRDARELLRLFGPQSLVPYHEDP